MEEPGERKPPRRPWPTASTRSTASRPPRTATSRSPTSSTRPPTTSCTTCEAALQEDARREGTGTLDNLKAAAAGEDEEVGIYTDYAKTAREEGFADLADFLRGPGRHREEPREPLPAAHRAHRERRGVPPQGSEGVCTVCGHIEIGTEPPRECPVLRAPAGLASRSRPRTFGFRR